MKTAKDIRVKGYKLTFSTELTDDRVEELLNDFLREVDSRNIPSLVLQMSDKEVGEAALSFFTNNN